MTAPRISVIIPYYNAARYLGEALASIEAQDYPATEIIIVDDGSDAENTAKLSTLKAKILRQDNQGPAAARNFGIQHATGEFIAFLDADDKWPADKIALQLAEFTREPTLELVSGRVKYEWDDGVKDPPLLFAADNTLFYVHLGAVLARRGVFDKTGLFDGALRFSEDHDWWLRVREKQIAYSILDRPTLIYRRHADNMTRGKDLKDFGMLEILKRSLDRRRKAAAQGTAQEMSTFQSHIKSS